MLNLFYARLILLQSAPMAAPQRFGQIIQRKETFFCDLTILFIGHCEILRVKEGNMIALPITVIKKYPKQLYFLHIHARLFMTFAPGSLFERFPALHPTAWHKPAILINMPDKQNFSILNEHNPYAQIDRMYDELINFTKPVQYPQDKGHECPRTGCGLYSSSSRFISSSESLILRAAMA